ncbi:MAG TPA: DUF885 family protein, partial [Steroidobacteraceae bacterium]
MPSPVRRESKGVLNSVQRYALLLAFTVILMTACSQGSQQSASKQPGDGRNDADARLRSIYSTEWQWREQQFADDEDSQKPIADHLPKVDPASQEARLRYWEDVLQKLDAIPLATLSPGEQINLDVYYPQIQVLIASQKFRDFEMPANSDTTFWTDIGYTARRNFRTAQDYRNWIGQMRDIPRYFHEQMDEMRA